MKSFEDQIKNFSSLWEFLAEKLTSWIFIIPLVVIFAVFIFLGVKTIYFIALAAGILTWNYWGSKIEIEDPVILLKINLESKKIGLTAVGRRLWRSIKKINGNPGEWISESGHSVHVVKNWDSENLTVEYPPQFFGDIEIAADPKKYAELIEKNLELTEENHFLKEDLEVKALLKAREWIKNYSDKIDEILMGGSDERN